jgi:hypothetical protein
MGQARRPEGATSEQGCPAELFKLQMQANDPFARRALRQYHSKESTCCSKGKQRYVEIARVRWHASKANLRCGTEKEIAVSTTLCVCVFRAFLMGAK